MFSTHLKTNFKFVIAFNLSSAVASILDLLKCFCLVNSKLQQIRRNLLKTLWEKEKMLVTSIFSFSLNVFNPRVNFYMLILKCRLLSNFSFSHSVFSPFLELSTFCINLKIVMCKLYILEESKTVAYDKELTLSQTSPGVYMSAVKHHGKRRNCS